MDVELVNFVRQALEKNISRSEIGNTLKQAGWADADIRSALGAYAKISFAVPVPRPKPYLSAREVFIYMVLFSTLYSLNYNLGAMIFEFINRLFPDPTQNHNLYSLFFDQTRWNIASVIITLPIFLYVFYIIDKSISADPTRRRSKPRKWLTYITLYIATSSIIGDLISLVYSMLGGELTVRFFLKVLTVALIAGGNFFYFISEMRREEEV